MPFMSSQAHMMRHDSIKAEKLTVLLSKIALIGKDLFNRILGMTTAGDTEREKGWSWENAGVISVVKTKP